MTSTFPDDARDTSSTASLAPGSGRVLENASPVGAWNALLLKGFAFTAGALVLAAIGSFSARKGPAPPGSAHQEAALLNVGGSEWLAGAATVPPSSPTVALAAPTPSQAMAPASHKVVLNTADLAELRRLPGIGQRRAEMILELRDKLHGFKKLTDLLRVKGIGPKGLRRMLPMLVLNPEPLPAASTAKAAGGSSVPP
jgi:competence ComEA-like helix-hairpin-helix protein